MTEPSSLASRLDDIRASLRDAARDAGRTVGDIRVLAVTKTRTADEVRSARAAGLVEFGENYLQEAVAKVTQIADPAIVWHFIGAIQSNKTRTIAAHFDWVHTVDREKIAKRLNEARTGMKPLNVCIQVNVDAEPQKAGVAPAGLAELVDLVCELPHLQLRGLMAIPQDQPNPEQTRPSFKKLRQLADAERTRLAERNAALAAAFDTLSMGMTRDYRIAIDEGSTLVRLGTAIFGPRQALETAAGGDAR